jgi:long-chain acyl-CoA synthetase
VKTNGGVVDEAPLLRVWPTVVHMLADAARLRPEAEALVCGDERLCYREVVACVAGFALELQAAGIGAGARVALVMGNSVDIAIGTFAVQAAGAQVVPLNPAYTASELAPMLADADAALAVCDAAVVQTLDTAVGAEPALVALRRIVIGDRPGMRRLTAWRDRPELADRLPLPDPQQLSTLQYTGGTTGRSKGVDMTHAAVAVNVSQREALVSTRADDERVLVVTPLFHVYAVAMGLYLAAHARGTLVVLARFQAEAVLETIARERITLLAASPTVLVGLLASETFARADLSSLRLVTSGAAALPEATLGRWEAATGCPIVEGYGQSEAGPVLAYNPRHGLRKAGTVGLPLPRTEIEIVDLATGRVAQPVGVEGEIRARGPQLMRGYRQRPEATAEALRDGWLHTGDIGAFDADGHLRICGRKKEMAIVAGFNVYPREVEEALCAHPQVREAAVVGVPDAYRGEALVATVVAAPGAAVDGEALLAWLAGRLVRYKVPQSIRVVEALPKTGVGKVDKAALRAQAMATQRP